MAIIVLWVSLLLSGGSRDVLLMWGISVSVISITGCDFMLRTDAVMGEE